MDIKLIRAFIASPSGLADERRAAHVVAQQVNDTVAREMGGRLELIGWEETLSGMGRPQALINADMETCELFIGAMWTKWGSKPALDGPYTSGFEEEFELSRVRHGRSGSPLMSVFFKEIDAVQLQDPGEDLKKVLAFQKRLRAEKKFLYDTFATTEAFADKVRAFLTTHTIRLLRNERSERDQKAAEPQQSQPDIGSSKNEAASRVSSAVDAQDSKFLVLAAQTLNTKDGPLPTDVARIRLIGAAAGKSENDKLTLGIHDANLLYQKRQNYEFSFQEKRGLLDAGLRELDHENVPVWTWLADLKSERPGLLTALTVIGEDSQRVGAITAMRLLAEPIKLPNTVIGDIPDKYWFSDTASSGIKVAALRYFGEHGDATHLLLIENEVSLADKETLTPALEAAVSIHLRSGKLDAGRYVLSVSFETLDDSLLAPALDGVRELEIDTLRLGLDHRSPRVRARTIETLSARGALGLDTIERAKDDDAPLVRLAALHALERLGQIPSLDEARKIMVRPRRVSGFLLMPRNTDPVGESFFEKYLTERLRRMPLDFVKALLSSESDRHAAYLALAARGVEDFPERLHADLSDSFASYAAQHWPEGIKTPYVATSLLTLGTSDPLETRRRDLVRLSLEIIADRRDKVDLPLVRRVLDSKFVSPSTGVVRFLRALGEPKDVLRLGQASPFASFWLSPPDSKSTFDEATRTILKICPDLLGDLLDLDLADDMLARIVDLASYAAFERLSNASILKLLLTDKTQLRRAAARKVPTSVSRKRVRQLLEAYRDDPDGRYYVVTHWLDLGLAYSRSAARRVVLSSS